MNKIAEYISSKSTLPLPDDFSEFLASESCGNCYLVQFTVEGEMHDDDVWIFKNDLDGFKDEFDEYFGRMDTALVPFGVGCCGDLYCLSLTISSNGKIVRFRHEYLDSGEVNDDFYKVIFNSITEFTHALKPLA